MIQHKGKDYYSLTELVKQVKFPDNREERDFSRSVYFWLNNGDIMNRGVFYSRLRPYMYTHELHYVFCRVGTQKRYFFNKEELLTFFKEHPNHRCSITIRLSSVTG